MADNSSNEAVDIMIKAIEKLCKKLINNGNFDKTVPCRIKTVLGNHEYTVTRNNNDYTAKSYFNYSVDEVVQVCLPQGKWKDAFITYPQKF